jgi:hypothetical protein
MSGWRRPTPYELFSGDFVRQQHLFEENRKRAFYFDRYVLRSGHTPAWVVANVGINVPSTPDEMDRVYNYDENGTMVRYHEDGTLRDNFGGVYSHSQIFG